MQLKDKIMTRMIHTIPYRYWVDLTPKEADEVMSKYHIIGSNQEHILRDELLLLPKEVKD